MHVRIIKQEATYIPFGLKGCPLDPDPFCDPGDDPFCGIILSVSIMAAPTSIEKVLNDSYSYYMHVSKERSIHFQSSIDGLRFRYAQITSLLLPKKSVIGWSHDGN